MAYSIIIIACWAVFLVVWGIGALGAKPDTQDRAGAYWAWRFLILAFIILAGSNVSGFDLTQRFSFQQDQTLAWVGAVLAVVGIAFAVWARVYLGRNWSSHPNRKADHELVTGGPYRYVRHPIYTGVILALIGTIFIGFAYTLIIIVVVCVMFILRIPKEERIMLELFPDQYLAYQKRTKKLVPFIW